MTPRSPRCAAMQDRERKVALSQVIWSSCNSRSCGNTSANRPRALAYISKTNIPSVDLSENRIGQVRWSRAKALRIFAHARADWKRARLHSRKPENPPDYLSRKLAVTTPGSRWPPMIHSLNGRCSLQSRHVAVANCAAQCGQTPPLWKVSKGCAQ